MIEQTTKTELGVADGDIVVFTASVRLYKGSPVLVVGSNKVIFLRLSDIKKACESKDGEIIAEGFVVKMSKSSFDKVYSFRKDFDGFAFEKDDTFDSLSEVARQQEEDKSVNIHRRGMIRMFYLENSIASL